MVSSGNRGEHLNSAGQKATSGHCWEELGEGAQLQGCPVQEVRAHWGAQSSDAEVGKGMEQFCCEEMLRAGTADGKAQKDLHSHIYTRGCDKGSGARLLMVPRAGQEELECRKCYRFIWSESGQILPWASQRQWRKHP